MAQFVEFTQRIVCTTLLHVARIVVDDEEVDVFLVQTVIGIDEMFVVGFTHVEHALVDSVQIVCHRLIVLSIHVYSAGEYQFLQECITHSIIVVAVSSVTDEQ